MRAKLVVFSHEHSEPDHNPGFIYTPKWDDELPQPFHVRAPPSPLRNVSYLTRIPSLIIEWMQCRSKYLPSNTQLNWSDFAHHSRIKKLRIKIKDSYAIDCSIFKEGIHVHHITPKIFIHGWMNVKMSHYLFQFWHPKSAFYS